MFPTGAAGAALFMLRVSVSASFLVDGSEGWALVNSWWTLLLFLLPAMLLIVGLLTPYASVISCLTQSAVVIRAGGYNKFHLLVAILNSAVVALLGPGAYSIDALIFGRRLLTVPPRN